MMKGKYKPGSGMDYDRGAAAHLYLHEGGFLTANMSLYNHLAGIVQGLGQRVSNGLENLVGRASHRPESHGAPLPCNAYEGYTIAYLGTRSTKSQKKENKRKPKRKGNREQRKKKLLLDKKKEKANRMTPKGTSKYARKKNDGNQEFWDQNLHNKPRAPEEPASKEDRPWYFRW